MRPFRRWCPRELVVHRGDIASTPWIAIFVPSTSDRWVLLVANQVKVKGADANFMSEIQSAGTAAQTDDA
jgi:hypothetical protein